MFLSNQEKQLEEKEHAVEECQVKMKESSSEEQRLNSMIKSRDEDLVTIRTEIQRKQDTLRAEIKSKQASLKEVDEAQTLEMSRLQEELKQARKNEQLALLKQHHQVYELNVCTVSSIYVLLNSV